MLDGSILGRPGLWLVMPMRGKPHRVQLSRRKGWRLPPNTIVVARPTRWGNPFRAATPAARPAAVAHYAQWIARPAQSRLRAAARRCLRGFHLACWCPPGGPCHADILLAIANG
jgi:hypothetical protein